MKKFITKFVFYLVLISLLGLTLYFTFAAINQVFVEQACSPINEAWVALKTNFNDYVIFSIVVSLLYSFSDLYAERILSFIEGMLSETTIVKLNFFIEKYQPSKRLIVINVLIPLLLLLIFIIMLFTQSIYC